MLPNRPDCLRLQNGKKMPLPFDAAEYDDRLEGLRDIMEMHDLDAVLLTSMQNVAYYAGFMTSAFGRPHGCLVTKTQSVTISAAIDGGQPWRQSVGDSLTYTDAQRDNFWRAVVSVVGTGKAIGCEADHLTMAQADKLNGFLQPRRGVDITLATMQQRMVKSTAELALMRGLAAVADLGAQAARDAIRVGVTERAVAIAARDAMEDQIAQRHPEAAHSGAQVWFQSGQATDGAYMPASNRVLRRGDVLALHCLPMISGYSAAVARTLFLGQADAASLQIWQASVDAHAFGLTLLRAGATCDQIARQLNGFLAERQLLDLCNTGYGHSYGILSPAHGYEPALDLREGVETELEPGMVISLAPMLSVAAGQPGAGGYRQVDIVIVTEDAPEQITRSLLGPDGNVLG